MRGIAVALAISTAVVLTNLARPEAADGSVAKPFLPTFLLALAVTAVFHVGLFWSPDARGWWRILAGALMVPSALMYGGLTGEVVMKVVRGYPLRAAPTIIAVAGLGIYLWQFWFLARRPHARGPAVNRPT